MIRPAQMENLMLLQESQEELQVAVAKYCATEHIQESTMSVVRVVEISYYPEAALEKLQQLPEDNNYGYSKQRVGYALITNEVIVQGRPPIPYLVLAQPGVSGGLFPVKLEIHDGELIPRNQVTKRLHPISFVGLKVKTDDSGSTYWKDPLDPEVGVYGYETLDKISRTTNPTIVIKATEVLEAFVQAKNDLLGTGLITQHSN